MVIYQIIDRANRYLTTILHVGLFFPMSSQKRS